MRLAILTIAALIAAVTHAPVAMASPTASDAAWALLAQRHDVGCAPVLAALGPDPGAALVAFAEERTMPPWAPVRAAACVAALPEAAPALSRWIVDPTRDGLVERVLRETPRLPAPQAAALVAIARAAPDPTRWARLLPPSDAPR